MVVRLAGMANERERESSQAKFSFDSEDTGPHTSQSRSIGPKAQESKVDPAFAGRDGNAIVIPCDTPGSRR